MLTSLQVCFNAVAPLFLIMALGYGAKCLGAISVDAVPSLNKLAFRYFMPVMLFRNLYDSSLSHAVQPKLLLFAVAAVLVMYGLSMALVLSTEKDPEKQGVKIQGMYRSNLAIIGLPLAKALAPGDMVTMHRALVATTMSPASSESPPICWVMVKEAMAVALANTLIRPAKPVSRMPSR